MIVANKFLSYRQALSGVLVALYPDLEVFEAEDEDLEREAARLRPDFVVGSRITPLTRELVPCWIELYGDHESTSVVCVNGDRSSFDGMELLDILAIVERVHRTLNGNGSSPNSDLP